MELEWPAQLSSWTVSPLAMLFLWQWFPCCCYPPAVGLRLTPEAGFLGFGHGCTAAVVGSCISEVMVLEAGKDFGSTFQSPLAFPRPPFQGTIIYLSTSENYKQLNTGIIWVFSISLSSAWILFIDSLIFLLCRIKGLLSTWSDSPKSETFPLKNVLFGILDEHKNVCRCCFHILPMVKSKPATQIPDKKSFSQSSI